MSKIEKTPEAKEREAHSAAIDESLEETFPASDPPAHQKDVRPENADAKWDVDKKSHETP